MALPDDVTTFTLTFGHATNGYTDSTGAVALVGTKAKLWPVDLATGRRLNVTHVASGQVIIPADITVTIDAEGKATVGPLPHTDNETLSPIGFGYHVEWQVGSGSRRAAPGDKTFAVPTAAGATVDFDLLDVAEAVEGVLVPIGVGPEGPQGPAGEFEGVGAGGALSGEYPNPGFNTTALATSVQAAIDDETIDLGLATVATTGAYTDLTGKPTLGTAAAQSTTAFDAAGSAAAAQAAAVQRANHTGQQTASTVSDFTEAAQDAAASLFTTATHVGMTAAYDDATGKLALTALDGQSPRSGAYLTPLAGVSAGAIPGAQLRASPITLAAAVTADRIGVEVTTASAGVTIRLAIYANSAATGLPGALLLDAGTVDASTTGFKEITISQALTATRYWLGAVASASGVSTRTNTNQTLIPSMAQGELTVAAAGVVQTSVTVLPDPLAATATTSATHRVYLRCA